MTDWPNAIRNDETLNEWGEFRLINELIEPILASVASPGLGDDCAKLPLDEAGDLLITSDVAPTPVVRQLGERSYTTWGWYAGLISASDLAAAGVEALALTTSIEAPGEMLVAELNDFFTGLADFCRSFSISTAGGNIREAATFACHTTAFGRTARAKSLGRHGCRPGDVIVSVGACGEFISAFLKAQEKGLDALSKPEQTRLLRPKPQLEAMLSLNRKGLLSAASDNSDGVLGTIWNIAEASKCAIEITMKDESIPDSVLEAARRTSINPWNLMFFWGDWQTVAAVPRDRYDRFVQEAGAQKIGFIKLGRALPGNPAIYGLYKNGRFRLPILRNEGFRSNSFTTQPLEHVLGMLRSPLFDCPVSAPSEDKR
jgi:thiamine-monophosphate kinase